MSMVVILAWLLVRQQKLIERLTHLENGCDDDQEDD
jgi:hypothetical protein